MEEGRLNGRKQGSPPTPGTPIPAVSGRAEGGREEALLGVKLRGNKLRLSDQTEAQPTDSGASNSECLSSPGDVPQAGPLGKEAEWAWTQLPWEVDSQYLPIATGGSCLALTCRGALISDLLELLNWLVLDLPWSSPPSPCCCSQEP